MNASEPVPQPTTYPPTVCRRSAGRSTTTAAPTDHWDAAGPNDLCGPLAATPAPSVSSTVVSA